MGDSLMATGTARAPQLPITDPKVCRSYLVGVCPNDLFTNTKQDNGPCPKQHNKAQKDEYEAADQAQKEQWGFEFDYLRDMGRLLDLRNRDIDEAQRRLEKSPEEIAQTNALLKSIIDQTRIIEDGIVEIKLLGELGDVNVAVTEYVKIRQARAIKEDRERELKNLSDTQGPSGHQKLQVCDVCGAYLSRLDNDRRLADHFFGKMHIGYAQMRRAHTALKEQLRDRKPPHRDESSYSSAPNNNRSGESRGYGGRGHREGHGGGYGGGGGGGYGGRQRW